MYEHFYHLRERPFSLSPDPEYLYLSRVHREALDAMRFGIQSRVGFIVVTGDIGAGKTTLLQTLLRRLDDQAVVARLVNTILEPRELLDAIALDFGLDPTGKSKPVLLRDLGEFLVNQRLQGRACLLVVDEAQNLSAEALEEIRLLSNLETDKSKLLQIVLAGQPSLRETIDSPVLEQLRQRVTVSYHLSPLDAGDTEAYINYRLEHAALGVPPRFSADAAELIHKRSQGVPRIINVICDAALIYGYAEERRSLDRPLVIEVVRELESTGILSTPRGIPRVAATAGRTERAIPTPAPQPAALRDGTRGRSDEDEPREAELRRLHQLVSVQEAELGRAREGLIRRENDLARREEALSARERRVAEQQRVLSEEYRLLRLQRRPGTARQAIDTTRAPSGSSDGMQPSARVGTSFWHRLFRTPALR
jgi:putative secretion ATPase (PEP-CTERM system associated)